MCLKLGNKCHCLTLLSILGFLQTLISLPIIVLSFLVFFQSSLGAALSPFWCGFLLLITGVVAIFIRPSRLACVIFLHVLLNAFSICACFLAAGITGLYGTAVQLSGYDEFELRREQDGSGAVDRCIFFNGSNLYSVEFSNAFRPVDAIVGSCRDLADNWEFLISIMSLSFMGLLISVIAIITNCITPCVEDRYDSEWSPGKTDV